MAAGGVEVVVECGPGTALTGMVKRIAPRLRTANVADPAGLEVAAALLGSGAPAPASA
jgi:[acyl-carrier-protein] S-malonyltransferase